MNDGPNTLRQRSKRVTTGKHKEQSDDNDRLSTTTSKNPKKNKEKQRRKYYIQPPAPFYIVTSQRADAVLAALGAGLCLAVLTMIQETFQVKTMGSFLLSASIKLFYNMEPPSLNAFAKSSAFCIPAGTLLHFLISNSNQYGHSMVVSVVLLYWKLNGEIWTAANSLAIYLAVGSGEWDLYRNDNDDFPYMYLITPYLTGHLFLYAFARLWSRVRFYARARLVTREFFNNTQEHDKTQLRDLFDRMDLDGNGRLDVHELQVAFRAVLECDISRIESEWIMKSTDTDGDLTLDFDEFCAAIDKMAWGSG